MFLLLSVQRRNIFPNRGWAHLHLRCGTRQKDDERWQQHRRWKRLHLIFKRLSLRNEGRQRWNKSDLPFLTLHRGPAAYFTPSQLPHASSHLHTLCQTRVNFEHEGLSSPYICSCLLLLQLPHAHSGKIVKPFNAIKMRVEYILNLFETKFAYYRNVDFSLSWGNDFWDHLRVRPCVGGYRKERSHLSTQMETPSLVAALAHRPINSPSG